MISQANIQATTPMGATRVDGVATFRAGATRNSCVFHRHLSRTPKIGSNRDNDAVIVGLASWERFYDPLICQIDIGPVCRLCVRE
jgi:hypothetical protein